MKRTERHHLKENEFAEWMLGAKEWYESNRQALVYGGIAILLVAVAVGGTMAYRQSQASAASRMLAEAMSVAEAPVVPPAAAEPGKAPTQAPGSYPTERARLEAALPKLVAAAEAHPASEAGIIARYRAASALVGLGRAAEGIKRYQEVADASTGVYRVMARLGIGDAQLAAGQFDAATATFKELAQQPSDDAPLDGVLMQLGRAYRLAGKAPDAKKTFKRVTDEFPQSPYAAVARRELDTLDAPAVASRN